MFRKKSHSHNTSLHYGNLCEALRNFSKLRLKQNPDPAYAKPGFPYIIYIYRSNTIGTVCRPFAAITLTLYAPLAMSEIFIFTVVFLESLISRTTLPLLS